MATNRELIAAVVSIRHTSDDLIQMIGSVSNDLARQGDMLSSTFEGKGSAMDAVMALMAATRTLADAASSMRALSRTCEEYLNIINL